jgi:hypothetical protein
VVRKVAGSDDARRSQLRESLASFNAHIRGYGTLITHNPGRVSDNTWSDTPHQVRVVYAMLYLMIGVSTAPRFAAAIPRAELVSLPAVGHVRCSTIPRS